MIAINYNSERDPIGNKYFAQYTDGHNISAMWKEFGSVRIEHDENIQSITFRLFDMKSIEKVDMILMQAPLYFKNWNTIVKDGVPKSITITPKEVTPFLDNTEGLTDKVTTRTISEKEYSQLRASTGFIT